MRKQTKSVLIGCLLVCFAMVLIPPLRDGTYGLIFSPGILIDTTKLLIQFLLVGLAGGAISLTMSKEGEEGNSGPVSSKSVTIGILSAVAFTGLIFAASKFMDAQKAAKEARELETLNQQHEMELQQRQIEESRIQQAAQEASNMRAMVQIQAAEEAAKKKDGLKSRVTWSKKLTRERGVTAVVHTYWRDDSMVFYFQLSGPPEPLEIAAGNHKHYKVRFNNSEGLTLFESPIDISSLKAYKGKSGAISELISGPISIQCEQVTYESISDWTLIDF